MPSYLKQSTASQSRALGPFVDSTDFLTPKTALTIANTDIKLVVNGGASANKNAGGGTHRVNGVYGVTFDATDSATVGEMDVSVVVAGALPVFEKFFVIEEAVYDALFAASATGVPTLCALEATAQAIKTKTDALPTDPADQSLIIAATDAIVAAIAALNNLSQANIRTAIGLASANLDTQLDALPTNSELATALAAADDAVLAAIAALNNLSQANVRTAVGLASANLDTQLDALPTNGELATALAAADDASLAAIAALNNLSAAQVNAEVVDALATDTYAEPGQGAPAATASVVAKLNFLHKLARTKIEQTATTLKIYNDAGTVVDHQATVSDDNVTYTRGEIVSGP